MLIFIILFMFNMLPTQASAMDSAGWSQTLECVGGLASANPFFYLGYGSLKFNGSKFFLIAEKEKPRLHIYTDKIAGFDDLYKNHGAHRLGGIFPLRIRFADSHPKRDAPGDFYLFVSRTDSNDWRESRINMAPIFVKGPPLENYGQVKAKEISGGPITITNYSGEPPPSTKFDNLILDKTVPKFSETPALNEESLNVLFSIIKKTLSSQESGPIPADSFLLYQTLEQCHEAAIARGDRALQQVIDKAKSPLTNYFKNINISMKVTIDTLKVSRNKKISAKVTVENLSDQPVKYFSWFCPENGNFQISDDCLELDMGNMSCAQNIPGKLELLKSHPLEKTLTFNISKKCQKKEVSFKFKFFEDGGFGNKKYPPLATSEELKLSINP